MSGRLWASFAGWVALAALGCSEPAGLRVDVAFGDFKSARSLRITIAASPDGFANHDSTNVGGATVTVEDVDGDGTPELVTEFLGPFSSGSLSFRVATGNHASLEMAGSALAFSDTSLIAGAQATTTLPAGGASTLSLSMTPSSSETIVPQTRTTDLLNVDADLTVDGPHSGSGGLGAQASAIAVCNLDGQAGPDLVVGVPGFDPRLNLGPTGAVFVVFDAGAAASPVTLSAGDASQFSFHGAEGGDQLGAAVACLDLNGDGLDDLLVAAPNANGGTGGLYAVLGRLGLKGTSIDLASHDRLPDATWTTTAENAHLGGALFASTVGSPAKPAVLVSAPGDHKVHLLDGLPASGLGDLDTLTHSTFASVHGAALGAGDLHDVGGALDVVIGDPTYVVAGDVKPSGAVYVFGGVSRGSPTAYDATATDAKGPSTMIVGPSQSGFGTALVALDTTGNHPDLFVGAPNDGDDGRGRVYVYEHDADFFHSPQRNYMTFKKQIETGVANGHFGAALGAVGSGAAAAASWRLAVGAPDELRAQRGAAGAAYLLGSGADRRFPVLDVLYGHAAGDHLGSAVTGGQVNGDAVGDLVTLAPSATGSDAGSGVAYIRYSRP